MTTQPCTIALFDPKYRADFARLNYAWITELFAVEPIDRRVLDNPEGEIVAQGGQVFFAFANGRVVGTVALKRESADAFELTKMAVDERERGNGYGQALLDAALAYSRAASAKRVVLASHTSLVPAIAMYRNAGFVERKDAGSGYSRCNIYMQMDM